MKTSPSYPESSEHLPPQAPDVERFVIASLVCTPSLIQEAIKLLTHDCFYGTTNRKVFICLEEMYNQKVPIDIITLSDELQKKEWLEAVGGELFLAELLNNAASASSIAYHANLLRENARLRKIHNASYALQNMLSLQTPIDEIISTIDSLKKSLSSTSDFESNIYIPTRDNCPTDTQPLIELSNVRIVSPGNIAMLTAGAGAGKSSTLEAACSAILNPMGDNLGFSVNVHSLLYIDSERSKYDHNLSWQRFLRRSGYGLSATNPPEIRWENVKAIGSLKDRLNYLWSRIDADDVPELVLLDGIGDFVSDVNNSEECTDLVYRLSAVADIRNIGILVTLHNNPSMNKDKARGMLGSELWRKCESVLIINKLDDDVRQLTTDYALGKNRSGSDKLASYFKWDFEQKMHISCGAPAEPNSKTTVERNNILKFIEERTEWSFKDLRESIMEFTGKEIRTAERKIRELTSLGKIVKSDSGTYSVSKKSLLKNTPYSHV